MQSALVFLIVALLIGQKLEAGASRKQLAGNVKLESRSYLQEAEFVL
jgi:hypothetical protein